ncbi:MAG: ATP-dependent metallopeptidase FtsH/Yme1/Tma family protein, partial [Oscillospiraceae bacterium]|nr:ATP-dependent metallopeptidase FtsH/Yme1/Tma family protein [Oscillospiraceae bacterium]
MQKKIKGFGTWIVLFLVIYILYALFSYMMTPHVKMVYSDLVNAIKNEQVSSMDISGNNVTATVTTEDGTTVRDVKIKIPSLDVLQADAGAEIAEQMAKGTLKQEASNAGASWISIGDLLVSVMVFVFFIFFFTRRGGGGGFTRMRAKTNTENCKVKFSDVAGAEEEK